MPLYICDTTLVMQKFHGNTRLIKKPWVPPPARTSKKWGNASALRSEVAANSGVPNPPTQDHQTLRPLPSEVLNDTFLIDPGVNGVPTSSSLVALPVSSYNSETVQNVNSLPFPMNTTSVQEKKIEDLYVNLQQLKSDFSRFRPICISFKESLRLLHKPISVSVMEELTVNQMVIQTDQHLREFLGIFDDLENHISSSELLLKGDILELTNRLEESSNCKEKLVVKCLEVYDSITSSLKFLVEIVQQENLSSLFADQEALTNKVQALEAEFLTREAKIQQLAKDLSFSQNKIESLQSQKHSLEEKVSRLNAALHQKESFLERLKPQTLPSSHEIRSIAENENLIKIMEALKEETESQKNALKKALKVQKLKTEQCGMTIHKLQSELDGKEHEMYTLASDRDQWKKQMTNVNFKFTEAENEIEHLKLKNVSLQKRLETSELAQVKSVAEINSMMEEKSQLLAVMEKEAEKLNATLKSVEQMFSAAENEKKLLSKKCASLEAKLQAQEKNLHNSECSRSDSDKDLHVLMPLLEELKESLSIIKESNLQTSNKENRTKGKSNLNVMNNSSENNIFALVKEIKDLIEMKEIHRYSLEDNIRNLHIASAESRRQEELNRYDQEIAEKQKLLEKIEERLNSTCVKNPVTERYHTHAMDTSVNLQAMENTSQMKMTSLEEELRNKNLELVSVLQQKSDMEHRNETQVRELRSNLDRVTTNYDSLQKYVAMLKSSYTNVFGPS